jgi:hypothetical protein
MRPLQSIDSTDQENRTEAAAITRLRAYLEGAHPQCVEDRSLRMSQANRQPTIVRA